MEANMLATCFRDVVLQRRWPLRVAEAVLSFLCASHMDAEVCPPSEPKDGHCLIQACKSIRWGHHEEQMTTEEFLADLACSITSRADLAAEARCRPRGSTSTLLLHGEEEELPDSNPPAAAMQTAAAGGDLEVDLEDEDDFQTMLLTMSLVIH